VQNSTCRPFSTIRNVQFDLKTARKVRFDQNLFRKEPRDLAKCDRNLSSEVDQVLGVSKLPEEIANAALDLAAAPELSVSPEQVVAPEQAVAPEIEVVAPELPTTCCMSGCVWLDYGKQVVEYYDTIGATMNFNNIYDPMIKAFIRIELKSKYSK
jgi:hypothetical protein